MNKNQLGKSDIYISELTLGCMSLGTDVKQASLIINRALEAGINHLDTADLYDFGKNEKVIGSLIQDQRDKIVLSTKVGNHFNKKTKEWFWDPSQEYIEEGLKNSLQRLKTDYIDFYMLHGGTIDDPIDETIETFEKLKKAELIRAYGISSIRPNVIREYVKRSNMDAVMMQYSILDRRPEEEMLDLLYDNDISVLARGPLAKGILSSKGKEQIENKGKTGYLEYTYQELKEMYDNMTKNLNGTYTVNEIALKYTLHHKAVASAVFGASSLEQVEENTHFDMSRKISSAIFDVLQQKSQEMKYTNHRSNH